MRSPGVRKSTCPLKESAINAAVGGPDGAGAPEAGGDLVEDHQGVVAPGEGGQVADTLGVVHVHAAGALEDGFDDDGGDLGGVLFVEVGRGCLPEVEVSIRGSFRRRYSTGEWSGLDTRLVPRGYSTDETSSLLDQRRSAGGGARRRVGGRGRRTWRACRLSGP